MDALILKLFESIAAQGPLVALLILILIGGLRKWWVWGWQWQETLKDLNLEREERQKEHERLRADRDRWRDIALQGTSLAQGFERHFPRKDP